MFSISDFSHTWTSTHKLDTVFLLCVCVFYVERIMLLSSYPDGIYYRWSVTLIYLMDFAVCVPRPRRRHPVCRVLAVGVLRPWSAAENGLLPGSFCCCFHCTWWYLPSTTHRKICRCKELLLSSWEMFNCLSVQASHMPQPGGGTQKMEWGRGTLKNDGKMQVGLPILQTRSGLQESIF